MYYNLNYEILNIFFNSSFPYNTVCRYHFQEYDNTHSFFINRLTIDLQLSNSVGDTSIDWSQKYDSISIPTLHCNE